MNNEMNTDMNSRVKEVRLSLGLSQAKFAQKIGFSQGGIKGVEVNTSRVTDRLILAMNKYQGPAGYEARRMPDK